MLIKRIDQIRFFHSCISSAEPGVFPFVSKDDSAWLLEMRDQLIRDLGFSRSSVPYSVISNPEGRSDILLTFISSIRQIAARFFLSNEITNCLILFPSSYKYTIKSNRNTFVIPLQGGFECNLNPNKHSSISISPNCEVLYVPSNQIISFVTKPETLVWIIELKKMTLQDCIQSLITRTMHQHALMRMGVPFQITSNSVGYKTSVSFEITTLIKLLEQEFLYYLKILNNPNLDFEEN